MSKADKFELSNSIYTAMHGVSWPVSADLVGVMQGLLRAQHTYMLSTKEIVKGKLRKRETLARLSMFDCLDIVYDCLSGENPLWEFFEYPEYALAIEWLEAALM